MAGADSPWRTSSTVVAPGGAAKRGWREPSGGGAVTARDYGPTAMGNEVVGRPRAGRVVHIERHVGLADVRPETTMRLHALARFLQDAADEDAATSTVAMPGAWVLRRLTMRIERTPRFRADLALATWCSGVG